MVSESLKVVRVVLAKAKISAIGHEGENVDRLAGSPGQKEQAAHDKEFGCGDEQGPRGKSPGLA